MYKYFKRAFDSIFSFIFLFLLLPVFLIISVFIKLDSKGPVFFKQKRIGLNSNQFTIYKFRSMSVETPANVATDLLTDSKSWITNIGKFLRKTSLDELPQLINIIKGDMSFVGPRPALPNQAELNTLRKLNKIDTILPGLTGYAQINGRDELEINKKVEYDEFYYKHISFKLDMFIVFMSFWVVFSQKGYQDGSSLK